MQSLKNALDQSDEIVENLYRQELPGSQQVVFLNLDSMQVGAMNRDSRPAGWPSVLFGGCRGKGSVENRIREAYENQN